MNDYYDVRLKTHRLEKLQAQDSFTFYPVDLEDREKVGKLFDDHPIRCVVNLAARAGVRYSMENPHVYMTTNAMGSLNLLEEMRRHEIKKYVLASTSSLYAGQEMPFLESLAVNTPISPYAASKKAAEAMTHAYHHLYNIDVSIVRYFTVYGPAGRPDMCIFRFIQWIDKGTPLQIFGDGTQTRDFTFVDDIARGTIAAMKPVGYEIVNIGGGKEPRSLLYVIEELEKLLGKKAKLEFHPMHPADIKETSADISKAEALLDWKPTTGLDEGLKSCVDWYQENLPWSADLKL